MVEHRLALVRVETLEERVVAADGHRCVGGSGHGGFGHQRPSVQAFPGPVRTGASRSPLRSATVTNRLRIALELAVTADGLRLEPVDDAPGLTLLVDEDRRVAQLLDLVADLVAVYGPAIADVLEGATLPAEAIERAEADDDGPEGPDDIRH